MHFTGKLKFAGILSVIGIFVFVVVIAVLSELGISNGSESGKRALRRKLKTLNESDEFDIPDIAATNVLGDICNCMTPQGICVANDYILITAYCNVENYKDDLESNSHVEANQERMISEENHHRHNSVVYILEKNTKEHISTLVFDDKSHVGGITFDGEYVWVAKGGSCKIEAYSYAGLEKHIVDDMASCKLPNPVYEFVCDYTTSFITYHNNSLWVGTFSSDTKLNGVLTQYCISYERGVQCLQSNKVIFIPPQANGAAFVDINDETYLAITTSYGRNNDSSLYFYSVRSTSDKYIWYSEYKVLTLPPMAEEICLDGENIYFLFESASTAYSNVEDNKCENVINTVRVNSARELIYER